MKKKCITTSYKSHYKCMGPSDHKELQSKLIPMVHGPLGTYLCLPPTSSCHKITHESLLLVLKTNFDRIKKKTAVQPTCFGVRQDWMCVGGKPFPPSNESWVCSTRCEDAACHSDPCDAGNAILNNVTLCPLKNDSCKNRFRQNICVSKRFLYGRDVSNNGWARFNCVLSFDERTPINKC